MDNKDNHSVIDWILQLDSTTPTTETSPNAQPFTFSPSTHPIINDTTSTPMLTKSELFEFYLGEEVDQVTKDSQGQQQTKRPAQMEDDKLFTTTTKRTKKVKPSGAEPLSGRLDFRPTMTDEVPESQLKAMSPRERRQLRNKISARNFRNRRKEYMTTLEEELDECKSENKKLNTELDIIKDKMIQLENENKQLRLDLVLYEQGINPSSCKHQNNNNNSNSNNNTGTLSSFELSPDTTLHALSSDSSASPPDLNNLHDFTYQPPSTIPHNNQPQLDPFQPLIRQPSPMAPLWNIQLPDFNLNDMYLSHAMMPNWDMDRVLSKSNEQSFTPTTPNVNVMDTFQRFPLLAPALMSIVVGHTMTLSTNDLLTLNFSNTAATTITTSPYSEPNNDKQALKIWELLQPIHQKSITYPVEEKEDGTTDEPTHEGKCHVTTFVASQVSLLHRYLKSYLCASVQNYLEVCRLESERQQGDVEEANVRNTTTRPRTPLCQKFRRAKEMFIPVS